jgi:hypothetical protein
VLTKIESFVSQIKSMIKNDQGRIENLIFGHDVSIFPWLITLPKNNPSRTTYKIQ